MRTGYAVHVINSYGVHNRHAGFMDVLDAGSMARAYMLHGCTSAAVTYDDGTYDVDKDGADTVIYALVHDSRGKLTRINCQERYTVNVVFMDYPRLADVRSSTRATQSRAIASRLCQAHMRRVKWLRDNTLSSTIAARLARYTAFSAPGRA